MVKNLLQYRRCGFEPWVGKITWRRHGNPLQYTCLENPIDRRSLGGYSPWGSKESDTTERLTRAHFWLLWVFVAVRAFSSSWKCGLLCIVVVYGLFIGVASLVEEHRL